VRYRASMRRNRTNLTGRLLLSALPDRAVEALDRIRADAQANNHIFDEAITKVHDAQPAATIRSSFIALLLIPNAGRTDDNLQAVVVIDTDKGLFISGIDAATFVGASWSRTCRLEQRAINAGCVSLGLISLNASAGPVAERLASKRRIKEDELSRHDFFVRPEDCDSTTLAESVARWGVPSDRLP
jgi:hypothetical protein